MQIYPRSAERLGPSAKLSLFTSSYNLIQHNSSISRFSIQSIQNSPLFLLVKSADSKKISKHLFSAGEAYRKPAVNFSLPTLPRISQFEIGELNNSDQSESIAIQISQTPQCRICLEPEDAELMISPCLCSGSQRFVHESCLKIWLLKSEKDDKELTSCEICKGKLNMNFVYAERCKPCNEKACKFWLPLVLAITIIATLVCFIVNGRLGSKVDVQAQAFIYVVLVALALISLGISVFYSRKLCDDSEVAEWHILNHQDGIIAV